MKLISKLLLAVLMSISGASFGAFSGGGSGTVTTFSCTTANGVSCSVANATTTPAATFTLGAITPSSVSTGAVTSSTLTNTGVVYAGTSGLLTTDATNFNYTAATKLLQIGAGAGADAGLIISASYFSGYGSIFTTKGGLGGAPVFTSDGADTQVYGSTNVQLLAPSIDIAPNGTLKFRQLATAGLGPAITAGIATTAVSALTLTGTIDYNAAAIDWVKWTLTDTSTHANTNAFNIIKDATSIFKVSKAGAIGMAKMTASGTAPGADNAKFEVVCGTNAGSAKLIMVAGTSATAVTVIDNVGAAVTGC